MPKPVKPLPDWEDLLSAACGLQSIVPGTTLVGGTAAAIHAKRHVSNDADHVMTDLRRNFNEILHQLESAVGWKTKRPVAPVMVLGSLDGIETGVRRLIRSEPLETVDIDFRGEKLTVPTEAEILRIKAFLILKRNATRDYLDFTALADHMGAVKSNEALRKFDKLYPQESGESALQQLMAQTSYPLPHDLAETDLSTYKNLAPRWQNWKNVMETLMRLAVDIFDLAPAPAPPPQVRPSPVSKASGPEDRRDSRARAAPKIKVP
ncbi:MAG: hypothetical protein LBO66_11480 [Deltaproteobacteria bacterium]|jgi:hypothetical protein|nr:hypothetical protein [Deltaproteobacteria bacterium]